MISSLIAYIDPMSGVLVLQILIAAIISGLAFFRRAIWGLIRTVFRIRTSSANSDDGGGKEPQEGDAS